MVSSQESNLFSAQLFTLIVEAGVRFWRSSSTLTLKSNEGLSSSEAELRSMHNNGQTKLMNRFVNWSKIFNNKERAGTLPTPGTCQADLYFLP